MKKTLAGLVAIGALLLGIGVVFTALAACSPPALGGTGTCAVPSNGQTLIGNGAGTYTSAVITPGSNVNITNASGSITISVISPATTTVNGSTGPNFNIAGTAGDISSSIAGATTTFDLANIISSGSCTNCNLTYDAKGRLTIAGSGVTGSVTTTIQVGATTITGPAFVFASSSLINLNASGNTVTISCPTCGTSNVSTSTTNTWSALQTLNGGISFTNASGTNETLSGYLVVNGALTDAQGNKYSTSTASGGSVGAATSSYVAYYNGSSTVTGTSTFSFISGMLTIQSLNGIQYAVDFPGADYATRINNAYAALPSSGGTIYGQCGYSTSTVSINFTTQYKQALLIGCGGGGFYLQGASTYQYNGTSSAFNYNVEQFSSGGVGVRNISFVGPAGVAGIGSSTLTSSIGLDIGGSFGAFGFEAQGIQISGFGRGFYVDNNVSFLNINHSVIQKNGQAIYNPQLAGANGENMQVSDSVIGDCNSATGNAADIAAQRSPLDCILIQDSGNVQWHWLRVSFDDAQWHSTQFGGTANINDFTDCHDEDPNTGIAPYPYRLTQSSFAGAAAVVIDEKGGDMMWDRTDQAPNEFIQFGGSLILDGVTGDINNNVSAPVNDFATPLNGQATISWHGLSNKGFNTNNSLNTGFTYVYGTQPYSVDGLSYGTSTAAYSFSTSTSAFDNAVQILSNNLTDANGNKYSTSTASAGAGGVATTTPFGAGYLPVTSSSLSLTNSSIYQDIPTFASIAIDATSSWISSPASTTVTVPITVGSGSNTMLFALAFATNGNVSATYNGVTMTPIILQVGSDTRALALFALPNPASGTHNIVFTASSSEAVFQGFGASYSGVAQTTSLDATTSTAPGTLSLVYPTTLKTLANNDWTFLAMRQSGGFANGISTSTMSNIVLRGLSSPTQPFTIAGDSGAPISPPQSFTMTTNANNTTGTSAYYSVMAGFAPAQISNGTNNIGINTTSTPANLTVGGTFQANQTSTFIGPVLDASGNKYVTSTSAGGGPSTSTANIWTALQTFNGGIVPPVNATPSSTGQIGVENTTSSYLTFNDGSTLNALSPYYKCFDWTIFNASTSADTQDYVTTIYNTSTLVGVYQMNVGSSTMQYNLEWNLSSASTTAQSSHAFTATTTSNNVTSTFITPTGSSTINSGYSLYFTASGPSVSSTQFGLTGICKVTP